MNYHDRYITFHSKVKLYNLLEPLSNDDACILGALALMNKASV